MSATNKRPAPLQLDAPRSRPRCPVCGAVSYSPEGVHPQCAMEQWDKSRMAVLRAAAATTTREAKPRNALVLRPWHRRCPKCSAQSHIRKPACACGHVFH